MRLLWKAIGNIAMTIPYIYRKWTIRGLVVKLLVSSSNPRPGGASIRSSDPPTGVCGRPVAPTEGNSSRVSATSYCIANGLEPVENHPISRHPFRRAPPTTTSPPIPDPGIERYHEAGQRGDIGKGVSTAGESSPGMRFVPCTGIDSDQRDSQATSQ